MVLHLKGNIAYCHEGCHWLALNVCSISLAFTPEGCQHCRRISKGSFCTDEFGNLLHGSIMCLTTSAGRDADMQPAPDAAPQA